MDAILLCGDRGASRHVKGVNKALLPVKGAPLFTHVLRALEGAARIERVFIVGDKKKLDSALVESGGSSKPVVTMDQWENLAANIWNGFLATLDGYTLGAERKRPELAGRMVFCVPGDSPLITPAEINEFLDRADMDRHDYMIGLTPEKALDRYLPARGKPGIRMTCFNVREGRFRINNMHIARPFAFQNRGAIQKMYNVRYQKNLRNIARMLKDLWAIRGVRPRLWIYIVMQVSMMLSLAGFSGLAAKASSLVSMDDVAGGVGAILGLRAGLVVTGHGGSAVDIDNDHDYDVMQAMYDEWTAAGKNMIGDAP
ncbi:MAG: nucleotidyltransferase family protein [Nitrospinae bacterium]|nr:nucleotidyltransferase family protein [Nitrospinota bacterium]